MHLISSKRNRLITLLIILTAILTGKVNAQSRYDAEIEKRIAQVENGLAGSIVIEGEKPGNILERMKLMKIPGLSIAIISNYKLEWAKAYGVADKQSGIPVTKESLFQAASISKSLNAVGALKLVQDNLIDPEADINNYLQTWKFPYDSVSEGNTISLINLLSHTAGLTIHGFPGYAVTDSFPSLQQVLDGKSPANTKAVRSQFVPGSRVQYSGGGTTISQLMITDQTKMPYHRFMNEKILKPLGMTMSFYDQPAPASKRKMLTTGHNGDGEPVTGLWHVYPEQAAAGLWTNPTDLAKYIIETQLSWAGKSALVLNQTYTKKRLQAVRENAALGVFVSEKAGVHYFQHGGANEGFRCQYVGDLENGNGVVVMINSDNGGILNEIINSVATVYKWKDYYKPDSRKVVTVPDSIMHSYVGDYKFAPGFSISVTFDGTTLWAQGTNQPSFPLLAESRTLFFTKVVDAKLEFSGEQMILHQNGQKLTAQKVKPADK